MLNRILTLLNIRAGEERNIFLMLAHYFFMGAAMLYVQSASYALFFDRWDISAMPFVYIGIAIIVSSITALFLKISERASLARFLILCLAFVLLGTIGLRAGLVFTSSKWLMLILPVWSQTLVNLSVMAFWTLAGSLFDVRQGKRIFGLMNAGSWLAYIVMGPFTTPLVNAFGTHNLYTVVAVCVFIAQIFQLAILRSNPATSAVPEVSQTARPQKSIFSLFQNRYIVLIFAITVVWRIAYFILDNIFYDRATLQFQNTAELAGFIGSFFSAVGVLGFITDTFLTGRIISRFGLRAGLLITPVLILISMGVFTILGFTSIGGLLAISFWLAVAGKFVNEGFGFSLDQSAVAVLFQPVAESDRVRAQTFGEGIVQPVAIGIAGGLLLLFSTLLKLNAFQLGAIYLIIGIAWFGVCVLLIKAYPNALTEALYKRRFGEDGLTITDTGRILVRKALASSKPEDVLYALRLLEASADPLYSQSLILLAESSKPEVRLDAIRRIERHELKKGIPTLLKRLRTETNLEIREAAARALSVLSQDTKSSLALLTDPDVQIRRGTLAGLLISKNKETLTPARHQLDELARSKSIKDKIEAARLIAEVGQPSLTETLLPLIEDSEVAVRKEALRAAGRIRHESLYPVLVHTLASPEARSLTLQAIIHGGDMALPHIIHGFQDESSNRRVQLRLVRACANIKSDSAIQTLEGWIDHPNTGVRSQVLAALHSCHFKVKGNSLPRVQEQIQTEIKRAAWLLASIVDINTSSKMEVLSRALMQDLDETRNRLFYLFGFIYDLQSIRRARNAFIKEGSSQRAFAVEMIDSILTTEHKNGFLPLLEEYPAHEMLGKLTRLHKQNKLTDAARLLDMLKNPLAGENPWLVIISIELARQMGLYTDNDIGQLHRKSDESMIRRIAKRTGKEAELLSVVERVIILKSLHMFASTPDEALAELADLLHEETVDGGDMIVKEGEPGESLYVIVRGRVEVLSGDHTLNQLGERAIFGELSLLDSATRTTSVRAAEETTLLRLDQTHFYEIMGDYVEVAMGTIHMLTRNLRERTAELATLKNSLGKS